MTMEGGGGVTPVNAGGRYIVQVFVGALSHQYEALSVEASKQTTADEIVACIVERLSMSGSLQVEGGGGGGGGVTSPSSFELAEVMGDWALGRECKERRLGAGERPVAVMLLWPKAELHHHYRFYLREKCGAADSVGGFAMDPQLVRDYFYRFLYQQPVDREYPDLCQLPDLNAATLLDNLRARFHAGHIYTYVGSILIALNPFKFHPIYNPKYVKLYQNRRLGPDLPPHIFAIADSAYHQMLRERRNQCVVISGESGSGKTESTNFLLHHLTALSQKGSHASGVEQTILSAGPVLEAFGNAKTAHNNNSSRFGKFIQVNYKENGMVHGAVVQKYLLEKSRICSQGRNERNYHVFYYLLAGASDADRQLLHLRPVAAYNYLNRSGCQQVDNVDENYEFSRLKQSMEMVGFTAEKQRRLFAVLSAVLLLGNVEFAPRKSTYHHDEAVAVRNQEQVALISQLLRVKQETLLAALTAKRARASGETLVINYRLPEAIAARDAMAKCLYGALFDWIVLQVNHALLSKKDTLRDHQGNSIGVLDIFGFEDFGLCNSFEQLCINYANEHLQHYFNQHVFKYEQEEYWKEGIRWSDIQFLDNTACLQLIEGKPSGLLCLLDDQCNFPGASNETLLQKFNSVHKDNNFYEMPQKREPAFIVRHYAGKVKYQVAEMREKNLDLMRCEMVGVLKKSSMAFVRELVGADPVAVFRWAILRAFFRAHFAFHDAGKRGRQCRDGTKPSLIHNRIQNHIPNENVIRYGLVHAPLSKAGPLRVLRPASVTTAAGGSSGVTSRKGATSPDSPRSTLFPAESARVIERATQIVMKNKSFRPRERGAGGKKGLKNLQTVKTLAGRTQVAGGPLVAATSGGQSAGGAAGKGRKQPLTVTAQFQHSLHSLMDTLNQANPFFIRCIKSNANKIPNKFDDDTVQRQLRYTGMLETVRIRQAGYNVRLSYDEFIQLYRILLPRGLLSSQNDVREFLLTLNLNRDNYQAGGSKIFLRECEKLKLDYRLHQQIVASIVAIQRWFRAVLEHRRFLRLRKAVLTLQTYWRQYLGQKCAVQLRQMRTAAVLVQRAWRAHRARTWYNRLRQATIAFQAHCRGYLSRRHLLLHTLKMQEEGSKEAVRLAGDSEQANHQHSETMKRLKALDANEQTREIRLGDPNKEILGVDARKKQSPRRAASKSYPDESIFNKVERKGSCDSLASNRSNDSQTNSAPVRDTLYRAKKQIQALMGKVKKSEGGGVSGGGVGGVVGGGVSGGGGAAQSGDSDADDSSCGEVWMQHRLPEELLLMSASPLCTPATVTEFVTPTVDHISSSSNSPTSPTTAKQKQLRRINNPVRRTEYLQRIPVTVIDYITPTIDHISSSSNSPTSPTAAPPSARRTVSAEPTAPTRRTARRLLVQADSDVSGPLVTVPSSLDLKRRNSDPTAVVGGGKGGVNPPLPQPPMSPPSPISLDRKSITMFTIAGHHFRKVARFAKDDRCRYCSRPMDVFVAEGHKCTDCKQLFHVKCIQNGGVVQVPCRPPSTHVSVSARRKLRKRSAAATRPSSGGAGGAPSAPPSSHHPAPPHAQFSLTGTSEFTDRTDKIISDVRELQKMQDFITQKICKIESDESGKKPSQVDRVFKQALREFKDNLVATYSVANKQDPEALNIKYKDLIANFIHVMETVCHQEQTKAEFPVTMGVNAFRGFLNEFMTLEQADKRPSKGKRKKEKKRKQEDPIVHAGHVFNIPIINIPTACEICTSFFMWPIERGLVCQNCKLTCHKKCYLKSAVECGAVVVGGSRGGGGAPQQHVVFGVPLRHLVAANGGESVPVVVERLITTIEMYGLYTEGIYRKSGVSSKVRELKVRIEEGKIDDVQLENYQVHVLTSVLKCFFREMPEPLLPFDRYDELLRAASLTEPQLRVSTLFAILNKLPKPNFDLMERLIFHLARVAQHEYVNRMNASALAIVFAPCILRTNKVLPAQDSLHDIGRQTRCIETIIAEQLGKVRATLADIDTLDTACHTASSRLSSLRTSKIFSAEELQEGAAVAAAKAASTSAKSEVGGGGGGKEQEEEEEEEMLLGQLEEIQKEKALLTSALPSLARASSDDDLLSTDDGSLDDVETQPTHLQLMQPQKGRTCRRSQAASNSAADAANNTNNNNAASTSIDDCDDDNPIMV